MTVTSLVSEVSDDSPGLAATHRRLSAVHDALGMTTTEETRTDCGQLLVSVVDHVASRSSLAEVWLLLVGITGQFPDQAAVRAARRQLDLTSSDHAARWLLGRLHAAARKSGSTHADLEIVTDRPCVDVNIAVKWSLRHVTGTQRVVLETARRWDLDRNIELVAWNKAGGAYRRLTAAEHGRIVGTPEADLTVSDPDPTVLVPWRVPLILLEVPGGQHSPALATMAEFTDTSLRLVGYDSIPAVSADLVPDFEPENFGYYVQAVKFADRVAAISKSATEEFRGLVATLGAQGLAGPEVATCSLPTESDIASDPGDAPPTPVRPIVLSLGTIGPRKNQLTTALAAELLWREGLDFELRLIGNDLRMGEALTDLVDRLNQLSRPLVLETRAPDARLAELLAQARCLVFPSLHEGFGLPVVEALSAGVPVIASNHGSLLEIAADGGVIVVDPEDVDAVADAMRSLLADDAAHAELAADVRRRPVRTWRDYADDLWAELGQ